MPTDGEVCSEVIINSLGPVPCLARGLPNTLMRQQSFIAFGATRLHFRSFKRVAIALQTLTAHVFVLYAPARRGGGVHCIRLRMAPLLLAKCACMLSTAGACPGALRQLARTGPAKSGELGGSTRPGDTKAWEGGTTA